MPDKKLPAVPETVLKKRKRQAENRALRAREAVKSKLARKAKRVEAFKRAEQYTKEYQNKERDEIRYQTSFSVFL
jgi:large subunit ribosomal protein L7e